jgi:hypothetical protein
MVAAAHTGADTAEMMVAAAHTGADTAEIMVMHI